METSEFFVASKWGVNSSFDTEYQKVEDARFTDAARCGNCSEIVGGRRWLPPYRVELWLHGSEWGDFAFFGDGDFLISKRAADSFKYAELIGLSGFEPVTVVKSHGSNQQPPVYLYVEIARSRIVVDEQRSRLVRDAPVTCNECRTGSLERIEGFFLEPKTWSGEDIFIARGLDGIVIASERLRELVNNSCLTNIRLTPTQEYFWDPYTPR